MKIPTIECPHCAGLGKVPISGSLAETLEAVRSQRGITAIQVHAKLGDQIGITAVNNRLEDLRRIGLLIRQRVGHQWMYHYTKLKTKNT